jgi:hypothetical protein
MRGWDLKPFLSSNPNQSKMINFEVLNYLLNQAYQLGREDENREERGIPPLDLEEEFKKVVDNMPNT